MALDCYCDYDPAEVHSVRTVKGRKEYACYECRGIIDAGEVHEYAFWVYDGGSYQARICSHCIAIRKFVSTNIPCWCWGYGNMDEDVRFIVEQAYHEAADEVRGVAFGVGRLFIKRRRERPRKPLRAAA